MKHIRFSIFIVLINILFVQTINAQWVQQTNGLPESWGTGWAIDACDSMTAVFLVNMEDHQPDAVFYTTDGGNNWNNITPFKVWGETANDVSIIDKNHIWLATSDVDSARILHTADGGETWSVQFNDSTKTQFFNYIEMFDLNNGIAMGDAPNFLGTASDSNKALFLRTYDGGENWNIMENNKPVFASGDTWRRLDFLSPDIGYFCETWGGQDNQGLKKTIDAGNNWAVIYPDLNIQLMKFYNEVIGLVRRVEYNQGNLAAYQVLRTLDGGENWESIETDSTGWANDFEFIPGDPSQVWFTDHHNLFFSSDTGRTWVKQNILEGEVEGRDIVFADKKHGWILGDNGKLFYTKNNGGIITNVNEEKKETLPTEFTLYQNYPNPFNPTTAIEYSIPANSFIPSGVEGSLVQLTVYDVLGREVATLVNQQQNPGNYTITFNASDLTSGVYFYTIKVGASTGLSADKAGSATNFVETKKMLLQK